jgi:hypothetical protein
MPFPYSGVLKFGRRYKNKINNWEFVITGIQFSEWSGKYAIIADVIINNEKNTDVCIWEETFLDTVILTKAEEKEEML